MLPRLPPLPVEVPVPRFVDPAPFAGYRLLPGTPASIAARVDLEGVAATLGACLRQLHDLRLDGVDGTPPRVGKTVRSLAMTRFPARYRALAESLEAPPPAEPRWIHGDLYPRHLLVDDAGALTGILDWGDVQLGDVALDLSVVLGWLPPPARPAFFDVYGPIDDATQVRARFLALYYGVVLADAAEQLGAPDLARLSAIYLGHATGDTE